MSSSLVKEVRKIIREAQRQGFRVEEKKSGWMVYEREGPRMVLLHKTPSDQRSLENDVARLRGIGFRWKGR